MDLQWFPGKPDHLLSWDQDIYLYKIDKLGAQGLPNETSAIEGPSRKTSKNLGITSMPISSDKTATIVSRLTDAQFPKAVDAYPGTDAEGMIAVGLSSGKVVLTSFGASIISKEFVPKNQRQINCLAWNKESPNYLGAALDKARSDYSVAIWDVGVNSKIVSSFHSDALRPTHELGNNETAHSIAWVSQKTFLVGLNFKYIKLFDLRDSQPKIDETAFTKAVYGLSLDGNHRVASFTEHQAFVWDMRKFEKPFVVLSHSKNLVKVGWCPTRPGLLACLEKESSFVQCHDVHHAALSSEDGLEPAVLERRLYPSYSSPPLLIKNMREIPISSFAWSPTEENTITTLTTNGVLWNSIVYERITLNWSPTSKLGWSNGKKIIQYIDNTDLVYSTLDDISVKMKQRALSGYGLKSNLKENASLVPEDSTLKNLWEWLDFSKTLTEKEKYRLNLNNVSPNSVKFPGVSSILKMNANSMSPLPFKSEIITNTYTELHGIKTYKSEERSFIQHLCNWDIDLLDPRLSFPSRRAALALFHLKLRSCIKILTESGDSIVAMAVAGFSESPSSLWREMATQSGGGLGDPYIRAIFSFLTEGESYYESILKCEGLSVSDRVGFACSFLSDAKLLNFFDELEKELVGRGSLDGILLTGMTGQSLPLLQKYLDTTGDIQTVSMLIVRTMSGDIPKCQLLPFWIERYRDLLNSWKLWEQRAEFDIIKNKSNTALIPPPEVIVSCNFCGKNISQSTMSGLNRNAQLFSRFAAANTRTKLSCCMNCRKPLPRCSICLLSMGTVLGSSKKGERERLRESQSPLPSNEQSFHSYCMSCKHGGHTLHLQKWFKSQVECPVNGCSCRCNSLDKIIDYSS